MTSTAARWGLWLPGILFAETGRCVFYFAFNDAEDGEMKIVIKFVCLVMGFCGLSLANAAPIQLLANGGFESGFSGWTTTANGSGSCDSDWRVGNNGGTTNCLSLSNPVSGAFAAYNSFDGNGPQIFRLSQSIVLPTSIAAASLSWLETYSLSFGGLPRQFLVELRDAANLNVLGTIDSQIFTGSAALGWSTFNDDVTSLFQTFEGQTVTLAFTNVIPQYFSGPAGFGLDSVSLLVTPGVVPEPASLALAGFGLAALGLTRRRKAQKAA